ncbi:MAG: hypothetical protein HRU38_14795 [Saccharospirillaceae bacterium]|nr:hypothetical protein [Pseudomonadales bacterium]NRB79909.1 hypothetical protein [Saccharospirillaceae bacterium]
MNQTDKQNIESEKSEETKPNGSEFLSGVGAVIGFLIGMLELGFELLTDGGMTSVAIGFLFSAFTLQLESKDNLGFQRKYGLRDSFLKAGVRVSLASFVFLIVMKYLF